MAASVPSATPVPSAAPVPSAVPVVLALGANLGDPVATLSAAVAELGRHLELTAVSPLARTQPVGGPEQPAYLNAVLLARTTLSPAALLELAHAVEQAAGRERLVRWGPRSLDVDLVQYGAGSGAVRQDDPELTLPHPRAHERAFVLVPWSQADPDAELVLADGRVARVARLAELAADRPGLEPGPPWPTRPTEAAG